jgi:hypothetical protein
VSINVISIILSVITTVVVVLGGIYAHLQLREAAANRKMTFLWDFYQQFRGKERTEFRERIIKGEIDPLKATGNEQFMLWQDIDDLEFLGALVFKDLVDQDWVTTLFYYSPPRLWKICQELILVERETVNPDVGIYFERLVGILQSKQVQSTVAKPIES